jgi:opacity protein-like surface antigen
LAAVLALGAALPAQAGSLDLRLGAFLPRADTGKTNDLFTDDAALYTVEKKDWRDFTGGIQLNVKLVRNVELGIGVDGYEQTLQTEYREYERDSGRAIQQSLKLEIVPISVELRLTPTSRRARVAPFIGAGVDLFAWKYEEFGDFIKFSDPALPVVEDSFISEGVSPGFHVSGGIRFGVTDDIGVTAQGRYQWGSADMGDDFRGNKLDLSGASLSVGLNFRF